MPDLQDIFEWLLNKYRCIFRLDKLCFIGLGNIFGYLILMYIFISLGVNNILQRKIKEMWYLNLK